jgi:hypothetical protein
MICLCGFSDHEINNACRGNCFFVVLSGWLNEFFAAVEQELVHTSVIVVAPHSGHPILQTAVFHASKLFDLEPPARSRKGRQSTWTTTWARQSSHFPSRLPALLIRPRRNGRRNRRGYRGFQHDEK